MKVPTVKVGEQDICDMYNLVYSTISTTERNLRPTIVNILPR